MTSYCRRRGIQQKLVRFFYEGKRISPESTPESLEMDKEEDQEVMFFFYFSEPFGLRYIHIIIEVQGYTK